MEKLKTVKTAYKAVYLITAISLYFISFTIGRLIFYIGHLLLIFAYMFMFNKRYIKLHFNEIVNTGILDKEN